MKTKKLPSFFKPCFWDVDFFDLDLSNDSEFIIKRTLDRGDTKSLKWVLSYYPREKIKETILTSRDLSQKTGNFWADIYNLDRTKILCLQKPYFPIPFGLSS